MATTIRRFFSRETEVSADVAASPERIWALLTDARGYPSWTSTVLSIEGEIAPSSRIALRSALDPKRTFKLAVKEFEPPRRLVWGDAMGTCCFELTPSGGGTRFSMRERIGGPLFPLFAGMIPAFDESFDRFAADLRREAEAR